MFLNKIPIIKTLMFFSWPTHKRALQKFITLWTLSTSPVILAILLSPIPAGSNSLWGSLVSKFTESISVSEQFVYAASFLSPVLYIIFERYISRDNDESMSERLRNSFKGVFDGYGLICFFATIVMLLTVSAYTATKTNLDYFESTFLYKFSTESSLWLYFYAVFCWYLSMLDGAATGEDFVRNTRENENQLADRFTARISRRSN